MLKLVLQTLAPGRVHCLLASALFSVHESPRKSLFKCRKGHASEHVAAHACWEEFLDGAMPFFFQDVTPCHYIIAASGEWCAESGLENKCRDGMQIVGLSRL